MNEKLLIVARLVSQTELIPVEMWPDLLSFQKFINDSLALSDMPDI